MSNKPEQMLQNGSVILAGLLTGHGFVYELKGTGKGSGGNYAWGIFRRGDRSLELHFRYSLGMVSYHLGDRSLSHEYYMRSVIGRPHASHYPGFADDPLEGFRHLRADLEEYGNDFLTGSNTDFLRHMDRSESWSRSEAKLPL
jgi:hypothetical protein